eukprot:13666178-Alexandrium_andersonii.AAC.1
MRVLGGVRACGLGFGSRCCLPVPACQFGSTGTSSGSSTEAPFPPPWRLDPRVESHLRCASQKRACVRACVRGCVRACVRARAG